MKPSYWALLPALSSLACGGPIAQWPPSPDGYRISVVVENDLTERSDILVRMVPSGGAPRLLGGSAPGEETTLEYRARTLGGSFTLTARTGDGRLYSSRPFTLFPDAVVIWRLQRNELRVVSGSGPIVASLSLGGRRNMLPTP